MRDTAHLLGDQQLLKFKSSIGKEAHRFHEPMNIALANERPALPSWTENIRIVAFEKDTDLIFRSDFPGNQAHVAFV